MGEHGSTSVKKRSLSSYLSNVNSRREELEKLKKKQVEEKLEEVRQDHENQKLPLQQPEQDMRDEQRSSEKRADGTLQEGQETDNGFKDSGKRDLKNVTDVKAIEQDVRDRETKNEPSTDSQTSNKPLEISGTSVDLQQDSSKTKPLTREDLHSMLKEPEEQSDPERGRHDMSSDRAPKVENRDSDEDVESDAPTEPASPPKPRRRRLIRGDKLRSMSPSHSTFDNESDSELSDIDELKSIHISSSILHGDSSPLKSTQEDLRRKRLASSPTMGKRYSGSPRQLKPDISTPRIGRHKKGVYRDAGGRTKLQISCDKGNYEQARRLIKEEHYDVNDQDNAGNTALHEAALNGHLDIVKLLTESGADVNIQSFEMFKDTPLIDASANGHLNVVKYLLAHGADPTICNAKGLTAYESIEEDSDLDENEQEIVSEIKKHLMSAAKNWNSEKSTQNVALTKEKTHKNSTQRLQASEESLDDFEFYWTDITSRAGKQKLFKASKEGKLSYIGSYLENGGRVDLRSFFEAVKLGHEDVASLFLAFGAQVNAVSKEGTTALITSVGRGHVGTVKLLLEAGADPRKKDKNGRTALYYAENSPIGVVDAEEVSLLRKASQDSGATVKEVVTEKPNDFKQEQMESSTNRRTSKKEDKHDEENDDDDENVISVGRKRRTVSPDLSETKRPSPSIQPLKSNESLEHIETPEELSDKPSPEPEAIKTQEETPEEKEQRLKAEEEYIQRRLQNKRKKEQELLRKLALDEEKREKERAEQRIKEAEKIAEAQRLRQIELDNHEKELEIHRRREIRSLYPLGLKLIDFNDKTDQDDFLPMYYVKLNQSNYVLDLQLCVILKNPELISQLTDIEKIPVAIKHRKQLWNILKTTFLYGGPKNKHLFNSPTPIESQLQFELQEYNKFSNLPMNWIKTQDIPFDDPNTRNRIQQEMVQIELQNNDNNEISRTTIKPSRHQTTHLPILPNKLQKRHTVSQLLQDYNSQSFW
ncbi:hypothetical protein HG537_0B03140 [Torulaspora globosa]|uniref:DUF7593 domain-containing protein n=1 Tax=Torulaspora globosa TaxID=48254 RepID=A0A7H9HQP9_9SACH|nr:hypothetical protein HG537_0B03140 [Torulaspora sp. CBS 2947]